MTRFLTWCVQGSFPQPSREKELSATSDDCIEEGTTYILPSQLTFSVAHHPLTRQKKYLNRYLDSRKLIFCLLLVIIVTLVINRASIIE